MRPLHAHTPAAADDLMTEHGTCFPPRELVCDDIPPGRTRCPDCIRYGHLWGCSSLGCDGGFLA